MQFSVLNILTSEHCTLLHHIYKTPNVFAKCATYMKGLISQALAYRLKSSFKGKLSKRTWNVIIAFPVFG